MQRRAGYEIGRSAKPVAQFIFQLVGRAGGIRTRGLLLSKQTRYCRSRKSQPARRNAPSPVVCAAQIVRAAQTSLAFED